MKKYLRCFLWATLAILTPVAPAIGAHTHLQTDAHWQSVMDQAAKLDTDGNASLAAGDAVTAESDFRQAIATVALVGTPYPSYSYDLAEALTTEGRTSQAILVYQNSILLPYPGNSAPAPAECNALLRYSLLLNESGHWAKAVAAIDAALPAFRGGSDRPRIAVSLNPGVPQPSVLAATAHVALGVDLTDYCDVQGNTDHQKALSEFAEGLELAPDWDVANYYYGVGLQKLGRTDLASAAFRKTVKMAKGNVKTAAELALKNQKKLV